MEAAREIYWNIGHSVIIPMYLLAFDAFGVMASGFRQCLLIWRQGKPLDRHEEV